MPVITLTFECKENTLGNLFQKTITFAKENFLAKQFFNACCACHVHNVQPLCNVFWSALTWLPFILSITSLYPITLYGCLRMSCRVCNVISQLCLWTAVQSVGLRKCLTSLCVHGCVHMCVGNGLYVIGINSLTVSYAWISQV